MALIRNDKKQVDNYIDILLFLKRRRRNAVLCRDVSPFFFVFHTTTTSISRFVVRWRRLPNKTEKRQQLREAQCYLSGNFVEKFERRESQPAYI